MICSKFVCFSYNSDVLLSDSPQLKMKYKLSYTEYSSTNACNYFTAAQQHLPPTVLTQYLWHAKCVFEVCHDGPNHGDSMRDRWSTSTWSHNILASHIQDKKRNKPWIILYTSLRGFIKSWINCNSLWRILVLELNLSVAERVLPPPYFPHRPFICSPFIKAPTPANLYIYVFTAFCGLPATHEQIRFFTAANTASSTLTCFPDNQLLSN